jgi:hypothetical protein
MRIAIVLLFAAAAAHAAKTLNVYDIDVEGAMETVKPAPDSIRHMRHGAAEWTTSW